MGCIQKAVIRHDVIFLLFLCFSRLTHSRVLTEGRAIFKLHKDSQVSRRDNVGMRIMLMIGSRPPRCERRCGSCGHCEAVQVPIGPQLKTQQTRMRSHFHFSAATPTIAYSRGGDVSDYKPMCWKCKCGDFMFNP